MKIRNYLLLIALLFSSSLAAVELTDRFTQEKYVIVDIQNSDTLVAGETLELVSLSDGRRFKVIVDNLVPLGHDLELEATELDGTQSYFFEIIHYR